MLGCVGRVWCMWGVCGVCGQVQCVGACAVRCGGVCVVVCEGACGCWGVSGVCGPWGEKVSLAALLFGYLGKSGHLPRYFHTLSSF